MHCDPLWPTIHCCSHRKVQIKPPQSSDLSFISMHFNSLLECIAIVKPKLNTMFNTALQWGQTQLNALFFVVLCCISELESFRRSWGVDCHESESDPLLDFSPSWSYFPLLIKEDDLNRTSPFLIDVDDISHFSFSPSRLYKSHV